jgi:hypothetical protein
MDSGIIGVLGTVLGVLIGGPVTYYYAKILIQETHKNATDLTQRQEFNNAAAEFRNAFLYELIFLKHNACIPEGERTYTTLNEFLFAGYVHRHLKAVEIFRNHLSTKDRANIEKTWQKYCKRPDDPNVLYFEQYSTKNVSNERERELKELALERIEEILEFAKHK